MAVWNDAHVLLIGIWFVFKLGAKWETWKNIIQVPEVLNNVPDSEWYRVRVDYGSWLYSRLLIGTLANLLIAGVGAYLGKHFWDIAGWLRLSQGGA